MEEVLRQGVGHRPGQVEQGRHIRLAEWLSREPGPDGRQQRVVAVHFLFEDDRGVGRQKPRVRRLPGQNEFGMPGQAVFGQVVFGNAGQVAFAGVGLRFAEPPLGEVPLAVRAFIRMASPRVAPKRPMAVSRNVSMIFRGWVRPESSPAASCRVFR